jgi:hypothetical protein
MLDRKKLTCSEAKKISIQDFLASEGYFPCSQKGYKLEYRSPLRDERHNSFVINTKSNIWIDFGGTTHADKLGGTIIDLGIRLLNCTIPELLRKLEGINFSPIQRVIYYENPKITPTEVKNISDIRLINYLKERCIEISIAQKFCREVHFDMNGKKYFAIGLENISKGWELRNKYFKGSCSPKDISLIKNGSEALCCFEGMFDFLSYFGSKLDLKRNADYLVLNSVSFFERSKEYIINYKEVHFFLDNDHAGTTTTGKLMGMCLVPCFDKSNEYKPHKDLNELIVSEKKKSLAMKNFKNIEPPGWNKSRGMSM